MEGDKMNQLVDELRRKGRVWRENEPFHEYVQRVNEAVTERCNETAEKIVYKAIMEERERNRINSNSERG